MNLFFLDFETTGLNPYYNDPIEIALKQYNSENYYQSFMIPNQLISSKIKVKLESETLFLTNLESILFLIKSLIS